jgi:acetolactate synthase-1/2/3 large subunit
VAGDGATVLDEVARLRPDLDPAAKWPGQAGQAVEVGQAGPREDARPAGHAGAAEQAREIVPPGQAGEAGPGGQAGEARLGEEAGAHPAASESPITGREVAEALNTVLRDDDILVEEMVTNAGVLHDVVRRTLPGTLAGTGSSGLGWGLGGAVGVKLAAPGRRVIAVVGDGSFMFAVPTAALCLAAEAGAPILAVVLNNDGYRASRLPVFDLFPDGVSAARGDAIGTRFRQAPDLAAVARACHAHGETVDERDELVPALRRGLKALEAGQSAVVDVHIAPN